MSRGLLIVFAKAPVPGRVKRRLIPALGALGAAALHERLVRHTLRTTTRSGCATELWCAPDTRHPFFARCAARFRVPRRAQAGADLGERMHHALSDALVRSDRAVLIGCDCPVLDASTLRAAFDALERHDVVLGPTEDGGYCLIGLRAPQPRLFEGMRWGTDAVLAETRARIRECGLDCAELPTMWDVDRPADLARLRKRLPRLLSNPA